MENNILKIIIFILLIIFCVGGIIFGKYIPLEIELYKVRKHAYTDTYRCKQFSDDLVSKLARHNIQSSVIIGESPDTIDTDMQHVWVGIWIEPQTGNFINNYQLTK